MVCGFVCACVRASVCSSLETVKVPLRSTEGTGSQETAARCLQLAFKTNPDLIVHFQHEEFEQVIQIRVCALPLLKTCQRKT